MAKTTGKRMNAAIRAADLGEADAVRTGREALYVGTKRYHMTRHTADGYPFGADAEGFGVSLRHSKGAFDDGEEFDASIVGGALVLRRGRDEWRIPLVEMPDPPKAPQLDYGPGADVDLNADALRKALKKPGKGAFATLVAGHDRDWNRVAFAVVRDGGGRIIGGARIGAWRPNDGDERTRRVRLDAEMLSRWLGRSKMQGLNILDEHYPIRATDYDDGYQLMLAPRISDEEDAREFEDEEDEYIKSLNLSRRAVWLLADGSIGRTVPSGNGFSRMDRYDPRGGLHIGKTAAAGTPVIRYCDSAGWPGPLRKVDPGIWDAFAAKDRRALKRFAKTVPELKGARL
jgi:hypothetical protein